MKNKIDFIYIKMIKSPEQGIFYIMNKLQKTLWSIFSGVICILLRPSDALSTSCWALVTKIKVSTCTDNSEMSSVIASYCYSQSGIKASKSDIVASACWYAYTNQTPNNYTVRNEMSNIYITTYHHTGYDSIGADENICNKEYQYYTCDPATNPVQSYCCTTCPTINGITASDLYADTNGYVASPMLSGNDVGNGVYLNICSAQTINGSSLDNNYFQVYKSISPCVVATTKQTAASCHKYNDGEPYSNTKGTYECAGDYVYKK